ncbi:hypothetical protein PsYK624_131960 [Phanerochaete sordida]|uniref:Uncharacterized protein n=1 Tax=Phanerochaete sordida TaxID=48140 RepID=A0A9P3LIX7_9APHY|nr:hypothetical protein PsYK624_131960 [Phanerochaete sordida]
MSDKLTYACQESTPGEYSRLSQGKQHNETDESQVMDASAPAELPLELWAPIVEVAVADYLDEFWMSLPKEDADDAAGQKNVLPNAVHSLSHVSFKARHATLLSLAQVLGLEYDGTHTGRLSADPQLRISALRDLWTSESFIMIDGSVATLAAHSQTLAVYAHLVSATGHLRAAVSVFIANAEAGKMVPLQPALQVALDSLFDTPTAEIPMEVCLRVQTRRKPVVVFASSLFKAGRAAHQFMYLCKAVARQRDVPVEQAPYSFPYNYAPSDRLIDALTSCLRGAINAYDVLCTYPRPRTLLRVVHTTLGDAALNILITQLAETARVEGPGERFTDIRAGAARVREAVEVIVAADGHDEDTVWV